MTETDSKDYWRNKSKNGRAAFRALKKIKFVT